MRAVSHEAACVSTREAIRQKGFEGACSAMTKLKIPTREERMQAGKALREKCPRLSHGKVVLGHGGKRDVVALIKASNEGRLEN